MCLATAAGNKQLLTRSRQSSQGLCHDLIPDDARSAIEYAVGKILFKAS